LQYAAFATVLPPVFHNNTLQRHSSIAVAGVAYSRVAAEYSHVAGK
jgi:hypothetical protein